MQDLSGLPEGLELRLRRVAAGLTLFEVGVRTGIEPPRLSEFERGRRALPPDDVARIRRALAVIPLSGNGVGDAA